MEINTQGGFTMFIVKKLQPVQAIECKYNSEDIFRSFNELQKRIDNLIENMKNNKDKKNKNF